MISLLRKKRGQSTLEYAILLVVIIMALIGMQAYLSRGISGRMKDATDQVGDQFSPISSTSNYITTTRSVINEQRDAWETTTHYDEQWSFREGNETIGNFEQEYWQ